MLATTMLLAALTIPVEPGKNPYDVALEYCQDKGGLAIYAPHGDVVDFSCGNEPAKMVTISNK